MLSGHNPFGNPPLSLFVTWLHTCPRPKRCGLYVLRLLAVAGVLAFMFSALSPDDDLTQQEFVHGKRSAQFLRLSSKVIRYSAAADRLLSATCLLTSLLVPGTSVRLAQNSSPPHLRILPNSPAGQRPPPSSHSADC